jgi:hypothetical protein
MAENWLDLADRASGVGSIIKLPLRDQTRWLGMRKISTFRAMLLKQIART